MSAEMVAAQKNKALALLKSDAENIRQLIEVQLENLSIRQCPLYEEVLDTQMFGFSRQIDFSIRLGLIDEETGRNLLGELERKLADLHETYIQR